MSILRKMKKLRLNSQVRKAFQGNSRGFSLVEIVIAIALIGVIAVAILGSLSYASTVLIIADSRATAESLARSQMEDVKNQPYIDYSESGHGYYDLITIPDGEEYELEPVIVEPLPLQDGLQKITVIVSYNILRYNISTHGSEVVPEQFTLEGYKREPVT